MTASKCLAVSMALLATLLNAQAAHALTLTVTTTADTVAGSFRSAIEGSNATEGFPDTIHFAIPANDPRHFYYHDDGVAGQVTPANTGTTTEANDGNIAGIDPDWPHSWFSIRPDSDLPEIDDTVLIDGYSQAGSVRNTLPTGGGLNTVLKIEIDGTNGTAAGLNFGLLPDVFPSNNRVEGLAINRSPGNGITLDTWGGNKIAGCFIGTDISGTVALGNGGDGVFLDNELDNTIGGTVPEARNLISGNSSNGIELSYSEDTLIQGNLIGTDRTGELGLVNKSSGILIDHAAGSTIGGTGSGAGNYIVPGQGRGVLVLSDVKRAKTEKSTLGNVKPNILPRRNGFIGNRFGPAPTPGPEPTPKPALAGQNGGAPIDRLKGTTSKFGLGIDLGGEGVTANDGDNPGTVQIDPDSDDGPNRLQNYPVLNSVTPGNLSTTIGGVLESQPNSSFRIEFFSSPACHLSGHGPGEQFLGFTMVTTGFNGIANIMAIVQEQVDPGAFITSTATWLEPGTGREETSEFSACFQVGGGSGPCSTPYPDFVTDAEIDAKDLLLLIQDIRQQGGLRDITGDLKTNADDLLKFTLSWHGENCSQGR
jgi:hypothetical protein